jgi:Acyl-CoA reductase (LuxC)
MSALAMPVAATPGDLAAAAARIRKYVAAPHSPQHAAEVFGAVIARWRHRGLPARREAIALIARQRQFSEPLLEASLDALLAPFTADALRSFAARAVERRDLLGFVMAGNVAGAGLHEVAIAMIAGAGMIIKTASAEPVLFRAIARTLTEHDPGLAARISVFTWPREQVELTVALRHATDAMVAYGDDSTIASLAGERPLFPFGGRLSGAIAMRNALGAAAQASVARGFARDVTLFEQLGCLSPHHVFVEAPSGREFARALSSEMAGIALTLPPPTSLLLEDSAALRIAREHARWRGLGGEPVEIFEGAGLAWTVIYDPGAIFTASPGLRTIRVSEFTDLDDLRTRLRPAQGRLEGFSVAASETETAQLGALLGALGVSHLAAPGAIQSPPVTWRHGGGAFLDWMTRHG